MSGFDRTGPMGLGARTGWGFGNCSRSARTAGGEDPSMGFWGARFGRGGGGVRTRSRWQRFPMGPALRRFGGWGTPSGGSDREVEKQDLVREADALQAQLNGVRDRLAAMEKSAPSDKPSPD